jgi:hypothetical protein
MPAQYAQSDAFFLRICLYPSKPCKKPLLFKEPVIIELDFESVAYCYILPLIIMKNQKSNQPCAENCQRTAIPEKMSAMVLERPGQALQFREVLVPRPERRQVLIKVHACGVCRTDLHMKRLRRCVTAGLKARPYWKFLNRKAGYPVRLSGEIVFS